MTKIYVGTSGWHFKDWVGPFYPEDMKSAEFLGYYARHFRAVEINNTFYRLPAVETLEGWRDTCRGGGMVFACKASRYITHMKKLKDPERSTARFFETVDVLGDRLGPVLFQLPPNWTADPERLRAFLDVLPRNRRYVFEFRDPSWFSQEVYDVLSGNNAAFCIYDLDGRQTPIEHTADFAYVRLHGPEGPYQGSYDGRTLSGWARRFRKWRDEGRDVYCFFDNDEKGYAVQDALRLQEMASRG